MWGWKQCEDVKCAERESRRGELDANEGHKMQWDGMRDE